MPDVCIGYMVPGPKGADGAAGAAGVKGINALTTLTLAFTMPAQLASATATVGSTAWMTPGEIVFVQSLGFMQVAAVLTSTTVSLTNLRNDVTGVYATNAAAGIIAAVGQAVVPSGLQGLSGTLSGAAGGDLKGTYPNPKLLTANPKGSLPVGNATDTVALAVGADGTRLRANSVVALGVDWTKVDLASATEVTGVLPSTNGGNSNRVLKAGDTMTGDLRISKIAPLVKPNDTSAAADNRLWYWGASGPNFIGSASDDVEAVVNNWVIVSRTGAAITSVTFPFGTITPSVQLTIGAQWNTPQVINAALAAGNNNNVDLTGKAYVTLKAGPAGAFTITGLASPTPATGARLLLHNRTTQTCTISNENVLSLAPNRLHSTTGADKTLSNDGFLELFYDLDLQRWIV